MVNYSSCNIARSRIINVHISVLLLLLANLNQEKFLAQGRSNFMQREFKKVDERHGIMKEISMIGSSPPRCKGLCPKCGPCEAVQVPATPQETKSTAASNPNINGRGDESSNYKPINWKCKCGNFIFNP